MAPDHIRKLSCYVSSPAFLDTAPLRQMLQALGFMVAEIDDEPPAGEHLASQLEERIRDAAFVCGVIPADLEAGSVMFELGVALGLGKPIFLIAGAKSALPASLRRVPFVEANVGDTDIIRFHLEVFAANLSLTSPPTLYGGRQATEINNLPTDQYARKKVSMAVPHVFYGGGESYPIANTAQIAALNEPDRRIAGAFQRAGASVTLSPRVGETREADMLVWLTDPDAGLLGPILVEIKNNLMDPFSQRTWEAVRAMLQKAHLRTAIIVTGAAEDKIQGRVADGNFIFSISVPTLETLSIRGDLVESLKRARNRLAHGFA